MVRYEAIKLAFEEQGALYHSIDVKYLIDLIEELQNTICNLNIALVGTDEFLDNYTGGTL